MARDILLKPGKDNEKLLLPDNLARDFGPRSAISKRCIAKLFDILQSGHPSLAIWNLRFGRIFGSDWQRSEKALNVYARKLGIEYDRSKPDVFIFALQTYYALLLQLLLRRFPALERIDISEEPFSWNIWAEHAELAAELKCLSAAMGEYYTSPFEDEASSSGDLLKALYQELFPHALRHQLGEYYTPDWLARHVLDQVGYGGRLNQRLLDPACGSGTFLLTAIGRIRRDRLASLNGRDCPDFRVSENGTVPFNDRILPDSSKLDLCKHIFSHVAGVDLNPLAVMTARANYLIAVSDLLSPDVIGDCPDFRLNENGTVPVEPIMQLEIPVYLGDSILDIPPHAALNSEQFDFVVGNPPWIAWDNLPADYREATKPLWEHYGLFSLSGNEARHGGGKKDLSMLMLYAVADRHLKSGGRLGFVITQTLFQTKGAGDGFRRFRIGNEGEWLRVERVDDLVALRPFGDAANWTSTVVLKKGMATQYPVPYFKWSEKQVVSQVENDRSGATGSASAYLDLGQDIHWQSQWRTSKETSQIGLAGSVTASQFLARPIDAARPGSPWFLQPRDFSVNMDDLIGPSDYVAHLGANTGGANGVYWLELLGPADGGVRVRNIPQKGKAHVDLVEAVIEPDLLYPLLRWGDITRYAVHPNYFLLLAQDCVTRTGIDASLMREKYPRTLAYLEHFENQLCARAAYRRYQQGSPFYSMYNVGPYTAAPMKVVWRRMDRRMNAAVATTVDHPLLGRRPVIPQETCVLVACDSLEEAHYLCAVLNSSLVNYIVQSHSVSGGKGFGTPNMLEYLNLRRFDPLNTVHKELVSCSEAAHRKTSPAIEKRINNLVGDLYGLDAEINFKQ
jgi:Eco57I restriction-modification methylase/N-6 DNA Methylase